MKSITLKLTDFNFIAVGAKTYFLNRRARQTQLLPTSCPHRGGPLHMGDTTGDGQALICPWHENHYKTCNLEKRALPSVRVGELISTVISDLERFEPLHKMSRHG